jgi:hypothetical protein
MSAAVWWDAHPSDAPAIVDGDSVLLDRQGAGAAILPMPDLHGYSHVTVVLICTRRVRYVVQMTTRTDPSWGWTAGDSCGGPDLGAYRSGRVSTANPPQELYVIVPGETHWDLTVFGEPVVKKIS